MFPEILYVLPLSAIFASGLMAFLHHVGTVRCPHCAENKPADRTWIYPYKSKAQVSAGRRDNGYQDGWREETRDHKTYTQHTDSLGRHLGTSTTVNTTSHMVPVRTVYFTEFYRCPDCNHRWSADKSKTHKL